MDLTDPPGGDGSVKEPARKRSRAPLLGRILFLVARFIYRTVRLTVVNERGLDVSGQGAIFVTWHGRSLVPANYFRNRGYWALISLSRDGEIQNEVFKNLGFHTIRGSTGRGGVRGALQMARKVREGGVLAFTPDGPRGPTHKVQLGVILMAEKSGAPIIPLGISASSRWSSRSWDAYMIPRPFSRVYFVVGEPRYVSGDGTEAARAAAAQGLERAINSVEREAERLAGYDTYPAEWPTD